jgi:hypothetical protein
MTDLSTTETAVEQLRLEPLPALDPAIGRALWQLEGARGRLKKALNGMDETMLDWEPYPDGNSVGTLLYHVAAIELDWLYFEVLEQEFPPEVQALLPYPVRDEDGRLFAVTAVSLTDPPAPPGHRPSDAAGRLRQPHPGRLSPGAPAAPIPCHAGVGAVSSDPTRNRTPGPDAGNKGALEFEGVDKSMKREA